MRYVLTLFDYGRRRPLQAMVIADKPEFYTLYMQNAGIKITQIEENITKIRENFSEETCINDYKTHIQAFNLPRVIGCPIYDLCIPHLNFKINNIETGKKILIKIAKEVVGMEIKPWQMLLSNAAVVYQSLEDIGARNGYMRIFPQYHLDTFAGRSSTSGSRRRRARGGRCPAVLARAAASSTGAGTSVSTSASSRSRARCSGARTTTSC